MPAPVVAVTSVKDGDRVGLTTMIAGTARYIPNDRRLWAVVQPEGSPNHHPQPGPVTMMPGGVWSVACYFGEPPQVGFRFALLLILADADANRTFNEYLVETRQRGTYPGLPLPAGAVPVAQVLHLVRV